VVAGKPAAVAAASGNLLKMQILGPQHRATESEALGAQSGKLLVTGDSNECWNLRTTPLRRGY
jgi:hypothetical protein